MVLLTGYQTPQALRRSGETRLRAWLAKRKVRSSDQIAATALVAAKAQQTVVPGQDVAASIVADLSAQLLATTAAAAGVAADREVLEQILATSHAERSATETWHDHHPDHAPPLPTLTLGGLGILGSPRGTGPRPLETPAQRPGLGR